MNTQKDDRYQQVNTYFPIIVFIITTFMMEAFGIGKATNFIISAFLSLISFAAMASTLKEKYGEYSERKQINFLIGLLSLMNIIIFANGFLHWSKIFHINLRWIIFFALLLIYFIILSRAVHTLRDIRIRLQQEQSKPRKK